MKLTDVYYDQYDMDLDENLMIAINLHTIERVKFNVVRKMAICEYYNKPDLGQKYYEEAKRENEEKGIIIPDYEKMEKLMVMTLGDLCTRYPLADEIDIFDKIREKDFYEYYKQAQKLSDQI
jgi:hypothetical protein